MTIGTDMLAALQRAVGEAGLAMEAGRTSDLYGFLTDGRDDLVQDLALAAPYAMPLVVALEEVTADPPVWGLPAAAAEPLRALAVRDSENGRELDPSASLNMDDGEYVWTSTRTIGLASHARVRGTPELVYIPAGAAAVDATTTQATLGLPQPCNIGVVRRAAMLALMADEESDATNATKLYNETLARLENLYGGFDLNDGLKMRHALMATLGRYAGDMID